MSARHVLTILAVSDLDASAAFYRAAFGWPSPVVTSAYIEFELPGGQRLGVYDRAGFARNTGELPALAPVGHITATELYFAVDDVDAALRRLLAAGARLLSAAAPRPWGDVAAYLADLDGNVLVVARPAARSAG